MRESKFNVSANKGDRTCDGIVFASKLEMMYYRDVVLPGIERGDIERYELQKPYLLQSAFQYKGKRYGKIEYVADFFIIYSDGKQSVIDTKGFPDRVAKLKRKLFLHLYPEIDYQWIGYSKIDGGWMPCEEIVRKRKERKKEKESLKIGYKEIKGEKG